MLKPLCRACGNRHAIGQCAQAVVPRNPFAKQAAAPAIAVDASPCPHCGKMRGSPVIPKGDRKTYMREYMRKRRANEAKR